MKKILVTGATGFIGQYVIEALLDKGYSVVASSYNKEKASAMSWFPRVDYIPFDLAGYDEGMNYFGFFHRPDAMIHLAWEGLPNYKADFHLTTNLPRHEALLHNLVTNGLADLTVTGTCLEYGLQEGCLSETTPAHPGNPYAVAKNILRERLEQMQEEHRFRLKWVRLFYMYGRGQSPNSILSQLERAIKNGEPVFNMSGGEQLRDYLPVTKVAEYIVKIAVQDRVEGIINCCSGVPVSINDLVNDYLAASGASIELNRGFYPYTDYEPMAFWGDAAKLSKAIEA